MKLRIPLLIVAATGVIFMSPASGQNSNPSVVECVTRLTREVDRPFRLTRARATQQCNEIARRVRDRSSQVLGTWTRRDEDGRTETMTFLDNGTARVRLYSYATRRMEEGTRPWAFVNPYNTVGSESLEFYPYLVGVEFAGNTMTISHQPTSSQNAWADRWTRVETPQQPRQANVEWSLPVQPTGNVSGFFDPSYPPTENRQHLGVDLPVAAGTPVRSPITGSVVANATSVADIMQSHLILREDGTGAEHVLGHISSSLRPTQRVTAGQVIGTVRLWPGEPSRSHVHWGANRRGIRAAIGPSPQGDWGWGRAPVTATEAQAVVRGWVNLNPFVGTSSPQASQGHIQNQSSPVAAAITSSVAVSERAYNVAGSCSDNKCLERELRNNGATQTQIGFAQRLSNLRDNAPTWAVGFDELGQVDLVSYNCAHCHIGGFAMVNGSPDLVIDASAFEAVETFWTRNRATIRGHPDAFIVRGVMLVEHRRRPDGGQQFVFARFVADCEACDRITAILYRFEFAANGTFAGHRVTGFSAISATRRGRWAPGN